MGKIYQIENEIKKLLEELFDKNLSTYIENKELKELMKAFCNKPEINSLLNCIFDKPIGSKININESFFCKYEIKCINEIKWKKYLSQRLGDYIIDYNKSENELKRIYKIDKETYIIKPSSTENEKFLTNYFMHQKKNEPICISKVKDAYNNNYKVDLSSEELDAFVSYFNENNKNFSLDTNGNKSLVFVPKEDEIKTFLNEQIINKNSCNDISVFSAEEIQESFFSQYNHILEKDYIIDFINKINGNEISIFVEKLPNDILVMREKKLESNHIFSTEIPQIFSEEKFMIYKKIHTELNVCLRKYGLEIRPKTDNKEYILTYSNMKNSKLLINEFSDFIKEKFQYSYIDLKVSLQSFHSKYDVKIDNEDLMEAINIANNNVYGISIFLEANELRSKQKEGVKILTCPVCNHEIPEKIIKNHFINSHTEKGASCIEKNGDHFSCNNCDTKNINLNKISFEIIRKHINGECKNKNFW